MRALYAEFKHSQYAKLGCDHHAVATVVTRVFSLQKVDREVTGMVAGAMSMMDVYPKGSF